ncbi:hypothetical protein HNR50_003299 [Spirochaeta isovalerica]|uniref:Uncharacterized protein n=1 Tax=Spirochaeta isovalerica TaxID=150 RepID=A0A841RFN5_9SPIO|nr:hypothetical protein [Spirochaeta isovalerica]
MAMTKKEKIFAGIAGFLGFCGLMVAVIAISFFMSM